MINLPVYLLLPYSWYCHADDDMYLNVPALSQLLDELMPQGKVYVGAGCHHHQSVSSNLSIFKIRVLSHWTF